MSNLERKLSAGEFVVTAELPVIDGGGHAELQRQLAPMRAFVDAFNATDNPAAHAHVSPLAVSIGLQEVGAEPGQESPGARGRSDGRGDVRHRQRVVLDR